VSPLFWSVIVLGGIAVWLLGLPGWQLIKVHASVIKLVDASVVDLFALNIVTVLFSVRHGACGHEIGVLTRPRSGVDACQLAPERYWHVTTTDTAPQTSFCEQKQTYLEYNLTSTGRMLTHPNMLH
jgi:hypothetical protein